MSSVVKFTLSVYDELAEIVDAYERGDNVIARQLVFKLRDRVEAIVDETGWLETRYQAVQP